MTKAHDRYNRLFRQMHKTFQIHHLALLMVKDYITILVGTLQRIHRQYVRYESALDDTLMVLCCSNVPLSVTPFQFNLEFGTTHRVALCVVHPRYSKSNRMNNKSQNSCCSVAFIEIKFQQKLCFNNQVLMLPSHSQRQCFKTDQVMKNAQILCLHSLI